METIVFNKKVKKYSSSAAFIVLEKPLLKIIECEPGDTVKVSITKLDNKTQEDAVERTLRKIKEETNADNVQIIIKDGTKKDD